MSPSPARRASSASIWKAARWHGASGAGLWRIVQAADDRLLVQTADAFVSLQAATGKVLWRHDAPGMLDGVLQQAAGGSPLLYAKREQKGPGDYLARLVWLDSKTGKVQGSSPLDGFHGDWLGLGPMVAHGGRTWCLAGMTPRPAPDAWAPMLPERSILEIR